MVEINCDLLRTIPMQKVSCNSKIVYLASIQNIASQINFILFSDKNITAYY